MLLNLSRELNQGSYAETNLETDYDEMIKRSEMVHDTIAAVE